MTERGFRKYSKIVGGIFIVLTVFLVFQILSLKFDFDFEKFFPSNQPETTFFEKYRSNFKSDNDFLLVGIEKKSGIFDKSFLEEVKRFESEVQSLELVDTVHSIVSLEEVFISGSGNVSTKPYFISENFNPVSDSIRWYSKNEIVGTFIPLDGKSVCLFVKHKDFLSKENSDVIIENLHQVIDQFSFEKVRVSGRTIGQKYYIDMMFSEMILYVGLSVILIVLFLFIAFRSGWGILVPQVVIAGSMIWVLGGMSLFHEPINIILAVLPSIMFVVSMSDVIHLTSRYLDAIREEDTIFKAITVAVKEVGLATLLTSITTAIGFFTLYFVKVQPIQAFGIVMGFGVLIAFVLTFLLLPILFYIFPGPKHVTVAKKDHFWKDHLIKWFGFLQNNKKLVLFSSIILMVIFGYGASRIEANNFMMDDLKATEPLKLDFNFFDEHYGGIRPFECSIELKDTSKTIWNKDVIEKLDSIQLFLENETGVNLKGSLISMIRLTNRSRHAGLQEYYAVPTSKSQLRNCTRILRSPKAKNLTRAYIDSTETLLRFTGAIGDIGNNAFTIKEKAFFDFVKKNKLDEFFTIQFTGTAYLVDKNMEYLASSLVKGLVISVFIVGLIIGLVYRSAVVLIISMITNLIPLVFIAGVMGYFGVELKTSTSIIFTIAFGIAVDDTIHFLGKFKYELMQGKSREEALRKSYLTTGKAMILTTLILCSGFVLLMMSNFMGTFYMGVLLSMTLFVALIADMTILPVLLMLFYHPKKKKDK